MIFLAVLDAVAMMIVYAIYVMVMALFYTCVLIFVVVAGLAVLVKAGISWALKRCRRKKLVNPCDDFYLTPEGKINYAAPKNPRDWRPRQ